MTYEQFLELFNLQDSGTNANRYWSYLDRQNEVEWTPTSDS